jgi:hypothetical protein
MLDDNPFLYFILRMASDPPDAIIPSQLVQDGKSCPVFNRTCANFMVAPYARLPDELPRFLEKEQGHPANYAFLQGLIRRAPALMQFFGRFSQANWQDTMIRSEDPAGAISAAL